MFQASYGYRQCGLRGGQGGLFLFPAGPGGLF
jgi:hypothetical protein